MIVAGFGFRVTGLSVEGLGEDELNKLNAVADYRANGLGGADGEHPMLMKSLQAATIIPVKKWNNSSFDCGSTGQSHRSRNRFAFAGVIFGAFSALLIF